MDEIKIAQEFDNLRSADDCSLENFGKVKSFSTANSVYFRVERISSDKNFPHEQALENVFSLFKPTDKSTDLKMIYYIRSDGQHLDFYMGAGISGSCSEARLDAVGNILSGSLRGNFRGSKLSDMQKGENIYKQLCKPHLLFSTVLGVPSCAKRAEDRDFQSVDHVIHSMNGKPFHIFIVWQALNKTQLDDMEVKLWNIYNNLTPRAGVSISKGEGESHSKKEGSAETKSNNTGTQYNECNKQLQLWIKALDEELLPRMRTGKASGMFLTSVYLGAETDEALSLLESSFTSVYQSDSPSAAPLLVRRLPRHSDTAKAISSAEFFSLPAKASWLALRSRQLNNGYTSMATCLTAKELAIIAGFPHSDIPGMEVSRRVSFGLNIPNERKGLKLGNLLRDGDPLDIPVEFCPADLDRHIFIAGTTGAGKTTTCHRILKDFGQSFMVIEPAKTEYRTLLHDPSMRNLYIFTVGNESAVPFRMNPFEFLPTENISAHIDMLKACFMASFDMEAAMPNLLEEAMYRLYEKFGWDISSNTNKFLPLKKEEAWSEKWKGLWFPTINDYIKMVVEVIKEKDFGERLQSEYIGSIRGRLESLTVGVKGRMLNTRRSIDFNWLLDQKVVIELEDLKSGEDKAFVMALIIGRLLEAIKARYHSASNGNVFRHILLIEEAHRLLTRLDFNNNPGRRLGVEMLTDMLAEVRKYHEGIIIVDQIPSKLASEVLKNTNTKIIHRLFAAEDKRTIGDAIALTKEQCEFLSQLDIGEAIISGNGWSKPVHVHIQPVGNTEDAINDKCAYKNGKDFWTENYQLFCPASPTKEKTPSPRTLQDMCFLTQKIYELLNPASKPIFREWQPQWQALLNQADKLAQGQAFLKNAVRTCLFAKNLLNNRNTDYDLDNISETVKGITTILLNNDELVQEIYTLLNKGRNLQFNEWHEFISKHNKESLNNAVSKCITAMNLINKNYMDLSDASKNVEENTKTLLDVKDEKEFFKDIKKLLP